MQTPRSRRRFLAEGAAIAAAAGPWRVHAEEAPALSAADAFAANVTREIVASQPQGNIVVSPYGVQGALALAALGATGATRDTLQSVVGLPDLDPAALRAAFSSPLVQSTRAAFVRRGAIAKSYAQAASQALAADVRALPHDPVQAAGTVNRWADDATHHRIERADFSGIAPLLSAAKLGDVLQQAWMNVDEEGMKAAAVTVVTIATASISRGKPPPLVLVFDRPFALIVRDKSALFAAVVRDPSIRA